MTRAEYQTKYGSSPVLHNDSEFDSEPTFSTQPRQMTREEYNNKYNLPTAAERSAEIFKPLIPARSDDTPLEAGAKATANLIPSAINLGAGLIQVALNPIDTTKSVFALTKGAGTKLAREATELAGFGDKADQVEESPEEQAFNQFFDFMKDNYYGVENLKNTATNDPFGFGIDALGLIVSGASSVGKLKKLEDLADATKAKAVDITAEAAAPLKAPTAELTQRAKAFVGRSDTQIIDGRADEIFSIESGNAKGRRINDLSKDGGADSRKRIASTDVLVGSVDDNGLIRTKQKGGAVEQYRKQTIDGFEGVVRQNLEREGALINLVEVKKNLDKTLFASGTEGSDLINALNKIKKEIQGLSIKADDFGNVPLTTLHDAKINTTRNIDFTKKASANYRRSLARGYKELVETKSKTNVKEINGELSKYYDDITRLENMDGRKVAGGKLGKYFAQITGNVAGGAAGSLAGPLGTAVGTIVGGEVSTALKGRTLAKSFGKNANVSKEKNAILEAAKETGTLPKKRDLTTPDLKVGAAADIQKTDEIIQLEKLIERNIKQQKVAISKKDFTLVSSLKDVYNTLVESLVEVIRAAKERFADTPNKEGGFIKVGDKTIKQIDEPTKLELLEVKKHLRGEVSSVSELDADRLLGKFGISQDQSVANIAKRIDEVVDKTKTKAVAPPDSLTAEAKKN